MCDQNFIFYTVLPYLTISFSGRSGYGVTFPDSGSRAAEACRYMSNHFDLNLELAQREAEGLPVVGPWDPNFD